MEIETSTRKWGNSIAVIIPSKIVEQEKLRENERVTIRIEKKKPLRVKDVFGLVRGWEKPTEEIIKEAKKGWD